MLQLHAELREYEQLEALDRRYVRLEPGTVNHTGVVELTVRGDWKDLHDFDQTVSRVAAALAAQGCTESLDVRRAVAVGILADPPAAHALLTGDPAPKPSKRITLYLHLSEAAVTGSEPVGRNETADQAVLTQQIRDWCGRTDTHLTVRPVIDLADHAQTGAYEIPDRLHDQSNLINATCVFPWCTRRARDCDTDHTTAHADGGPTCTCNLAPLCRHHHRLKTHTAWTYRPLDPVTDPGTYLWTDPHRLKYLRTPAGTTDILSGAPPPWPGCARSSDSLSGPAPPSA